MKYESCTYISKCVIAWSHVSEREVPCNNYVLENDQAHVNYSVILAFTNSLLS